MKTFKQFLNESNEKKAHIELRQDLSSKEKEEIRKMMQGSIFGLNDAIKNGFDMLYNDKEFLEKRWKKYASKINLNESKVERDYQDGGQISFDSIGSGLEVRINPFTYPMRSAGENMVHRLSFGVYSSGAVDYYKDPSDEEVELYNGYKDGSIKLDKNNHPYGIRMKEDKKIMADVKKAMDEFDKKIESIAKKYGYKKVK